MEIPEKDNYTKDMKFVHPIIEMLACTDITKEYHFDMFRLLSCNPNSTINFLKKKENYSYFSQTFLSCNRNIKPSDIKRYKDINLTNCFMYSVNIFSGKEYVDLAIKSEDYEIYLQNENVDRFCIDRVLKHLSIKHESRSFFDITYTGLSRNPNLTWEHVKSDILKYDLYEVVKNENITFCNALEVFKDVNMENYGKYYSPEKIFNCFSENFNINIDIVKEYRNIDGFNWRLISANPGISLKDIIENIDLPWEWMYVSSNPSITWEDYINHPELPWDKKGLSLNPNITFDILMKTNDTFYPTLLSKNLFCHHPYYKSNKYKLILVKRFMSACFQELIEKSCDCSRLLNWNEGIAEEIPPEYKKECERYNRMFSSVETYDIVVIADE